MPWVFNQNDHPLGQYGHFNQVGPSEKSHFFIMMKCEIIINFLNSIKAKKRKGWTSAIEPALKTKKMISGRLNLLMW